MIHSSEASSSESSAATVVGSIGCDDGVGRFVTVVRVSLERECGRAGMVPVADGGAELGADVGDGVRRRSGAVAVVGDAAVAPVLLLEAPGFGDFCWGGGIGGSPPFPRPLRIVRVSFRRVWARSCCPLDTSVKALVSMSEVKSSIRRCTTLGWGGMRGVLGQVDFLF